VTESCENTSLTPGNSHKKLPTPIKKSGILCLQCVIKFTIMTTKTIKCGLGNIATCLGSSDNKELNNCYSCCEAIMERNWNRYIFATSCETIVKMEALWGFNMSTCNVLPGNKFKKQLIAYPLYLIRDSSHIAMKLSHTNNLHNVRNCACNEK
jgi:hypothetical protein